MQSIRASIDVRASVAETLRRWSEFASFTRRAARTGTAPSLPEGAASGMVAFRPLNEAESRVTVELEVGRVAPPPNGLIERARRELERDLSAFKRFLEGS